MQQPDVALCSVLERPGDLSARLAYSEALDAVADPLGEFIRLDCRLADDPRHDDALKDWDRRHALYELHQGSWIGRLSQIRASPTLQCGLVSGISLDLDDYLEHGDEIFGRHPIRAVAIRGTRGRMNDLLASRWMDRIEYLSLVSGATPDDQGPNDEDVEELAASDQAFNLRGLGLNGNKRIGPAGVRAILDAPWCERLEYLDLGWTSSGDEGAELLASANALVDLRRLNLSASGMSGVGARSLAESPTLARLGLTEFNTSCNGIEPEDQARLLRSPIMARVASIQLGGRLDGDMVDALIGSDSLGSMRRLSCANDWGLETAAVRKLARWPGLGRLDRLTFILSALTDEQLGMLAASPWLADLHTFDLSETKVTDDGVERLCRSPAWRSLTHLSLDRNGLTERSIRALTTAGCFPRLQTLDLFATYTIGDAGATALAEYGGSTRLRQLGLCVAGISDVGALKLANARFAAQLWKLWLTGNEKISPAIGKHLRKRMGNRVFIDEPKDRPDRIGVTR